MITSKQRAYLRALANDMRPIFQIGKGGINENMVSQLSDALSVRELIKIHVLNNSEYSAKEALFELAEQLGAEQVCAIGNNLVLYRQAEKEQYRNITLP